MKRLFMIVVCLISVVSLFAGCGSNGKNAGETKIDTVKEQKVNPEVNKKIKLVYWAYDSGDSIRKGIVERFNATHSNIEVSLEEIPWNAHHDKLITSLAAKSGPDVFDGKMIWMPEFLGLDAVEELSSYLNKWQGKDDIMKSIWDIVTTKEGKVYGLPYDLGAQFLYYRKDIFDKAGLKPPTTYAEFSDVAKKLTQDTNNDGKIDQYGFGLRGGRFGHEAWASFVLANMKNPSFFDKDGKPMFTDPDAVEANQLWLDMYVKYKAAPDSSITDGFDQIAGNLQAGITTMTIQHIKTAARLSPMLGDKLAAVPLPAGKHGKSISYVGDWETHLNKDIDKDKQEAGFTFMSWLSEKEQIKEWCKGLRSVPVVSSLKDDPEFMNNPFQKASMIALENAAIIPVDPKMGEWTEVTWPQVTQQALLGKLTSKQMMEKLSEPFQK